MIKLAVCDDEAPVVKAIERLILAYNQTHRDSGTFAVSKYTSPRLLLDDVAEGEVYDAFLLDVEMREMDGLTLAAKLRSATPDAPLVFLSSHTEFGIVQDGFKVHALRYVDKLTMEKDLPEALSAVAQAVRKSEKSFYTFTHYSESIRLPYREIKYVHRVGRVTEIVTEKNGSLQSSKPLKELFDELHSDWFVFIDKSCFVNLNHVLGIADSAVILKSGEKLDVSRNRLSQVKLAINYLWGD